MNFWFFSLGIALVILVFLDLVLTTFAPTGSGFVTGKLRRWVWKLFLWLSGHKGSSSILNYAGPVTIVIWLMGWLLMLWAGNALIVIAADDSVISSNNMRSTTWQEKLYFTGYTLSTLGSGEFIPFGTSWQIYSAFISFSGFILITIGLTYLYSVVSNDINRRKNSLKIYHMGATPQEILLRYWDGKSFNRLKNELSSLSEQILQVAQNHMAYPVLHNFHSTRREENLVINIVCLDEALTLLLLNKPSNVDPHLAELYPLRSAITYYLQTLRNAFINPSKEEPPAPDVRPLIANGLPLQGKSAEFLKYEDISLRRKLLRGLLKSQGWDWEIVENYHSKDPLDRWLTTVREDRQYPWPKPHQNENNEKRKELNQKD